MEISYYVTIYHFTKIVDGEYTIACEHILGKRKKRELEKDLTAIGYDGVRVLDIEYEKRKSMVSPSKLNEILPHESTEE